MLVPNIGHYFEFGANFRTAPMNNRIFCYVHMKVHIISFLLKIIHSSSCFFQLPHRWAAGGGIENKEGTLGGGEGESQS